MWPHIIYFMNRTSVNRNFQTERCTIDYRRRRRGLSLSIQQIAYARARARPHEIRRAIIYLALETSAAELRLMLVAVLSGGQSWCWED